MFKYKKILLYIVKQAYRHITIIITSYLSLSLFIIIVIIIIIIIII